MIEHMFYILILAGVTYSVGYLIGLQDGAWQQHTKWMDKIYGNYTRERDR